MRFASFFTVFALFAPLHKCFYVPEQSLPLPFTSQVRQRLLYAGNTRHGLLLEMNPDGSVQGSPVERPYCLMKLSSVKAGETVIQSVQTSLYLCVDDEDNLKGEPNYSKERCTFQEQLLSDGYSLLLSPQTQLPVSLHSKQRHGPPFSLFLPLMSSAAGRGEDSQIQEVKPYIQDINLDSDDPLGMRHQSHIQTLFSPSFHTKK